MPPKQHIIFSQSGNIIRQIKSNLYLLFFPILSAMPQGFSKAILTFSENGKTTHKKPVFQLKSG